MSAINEGGQIRNLAANANETLNNDTYMGTDVNEFPREFNASTSRDQLLQWKHEQAAGGAVGDFGIVTQSDKDLEAVLAKQKAAEFAKFEQWVGQTFNDPENFALKKWLMGAYPNFFKAREKVILDHAKMVTRVKLIQLRGPKDEEDLKLQYAIQNGLIQLNDDWDTIGRTKANSEWAGSIISNNVAQRLSQFSRFLSGAERDANMTSAKSKVGDPFGTVDFRDSAPRFSFGDVVGATNPQFKYQNNSKVFGT